MSTASSTHVKNPQRSTPETVASSTVSTDSKAKENEDFVVLICETYSNLDYEDIFKRKIEINDKINSLV